MFKCVNGFKNITLCVSSINWIIRYIVLFQSFDRSHWDWRRPIDLPSVPIHSNEVCVISVAWDLTEVLNLVMAVIWHWKLRVIIMTTCGAISDDKIGIRKTPCVQWWCGWYFVNNVSADGLASASQHQETQWWLSCIKPTFESYFIYKHIRFLTSVWGLLLSGLYCIGYPCVYVNHVMLNLMRKYWYEHICVFIIFLDT